MKKLIASVAAVISLVATAAPIGYIGELVDGQFSLLLHNTPCENTKALEKVKEKFRKDFFHGEYTNAEGKTITACWAINGDTIYISDEEGGVGKLPSNLVKPLTKL